jgi:hypothetical protein
MLSGWALWVRLRLALIAYGLALCSPSYATETPDAESSVRHTRERISLTAYPGFSEACAAFVDGYLPKAGDASQLVPRLDHFIGNCRNRKTPLVVGVTHENTKNNHTGAANNLPNISSHMSDFKYGFDFGRWLDLKILDVDSSSVLLLRLDTKNFRQLNVTGWPLQYGHLFVGVTDQSVVASLDKNIIVELDVRIHDEPLNTKNEFNGRRVLIGALGKWDEAAPRKNQTHFLEINLNETDGFPASYNEQKYPLCNDFVYDRCFYSDGRFAEGREISYNQLAGSSILQDTQDWLHIRLDVSQLFRRLRWVSPPPSWAAAKIEAMYLAVESTGATATTVEFRNYSVWSPRNY